jgi:hypothetical protein
MTSQDVDGTAWDALVVGARPAGISHGRRLNAPSHPTLS